MTSELSARRERAMLARIDELEARLRRLTRLSDGEAPAFTGPVIARLVEAAAAEFGVRAAAVFGPQRGAQLARARQVVMYIAAVRQHRSLPQIGRSLARDHSTVWHGVRRVEAMVREDPAFAERVERVAKAGLAATLTESPA